jgi:hypothetical protein
MGYLNKIFGENIGARVGTAIGIGPGAGQAISDTLSIITPGSDTAATVQPPGNEGVETGTSGNDGRVNQPPTGGGGFTNVSTGGGGGGMQNVPYTIIDESGGGMQNVAIGQFGAFFGPRIIGGLAAAFAGALELFQAGFFETYNAKPPRFTRKLQAQMKQAVLVVGIDEVAKKFGTKPDVLAILLMKRFPPRPITISRAKINACKKLARDVNRANGAVGDLKKMLGTSTPRRPARRKTAMSTSAGKTIAIS